MDNNTLGNSNIKMFPACLLYEEGMKNIDLKKKKRGVILTSHGYKQYGPNNGSEHRKHVWSYVCKTFSPIHYTIALNL